VVRGRGDGKVFVETMWPGKEVVDNFFGDWWS
jgi:hypothetical protein